MSDPGIVIAGAGHAGFQTALSLRSEGYAGSITLLDAQTEFPYQRPPLSKAYMEGKMSADRLLFRPASALGDLRLTYRQGETLVKIDRVEKTVLIASEETIDYDHLVLALGSRNRPPNIPGAELAGVFGLRVRNDADMLAAALAEASDVIAIGGGFIGLEFAAVARAQGKRVRVIEIATRLMERAVSTPLSHAVHTTLSGLGVEFEFATTVRRILDRHGRASGVQLSDGRVFDADLVLIGTGVLPNDDIARTAGLAVDRGILVDETLLTSDPHISAVGDVARFPASEAGTMIMVESVQNAVDQAKCVASRLTGRAAAYRAVPWFWSDQGPMKIQIAGLARPGDPAIVSHNEASAITICRFRDERLVAVETINRSGDHMAGRKIIGQSASPTMNDVSQPGFQLRAWSSQPG